MPILIKNIRGLAGVYENAPKFLRGTEMDHLPVLENAFLAIDEGRISAYGSMDEWGGISDWRNLEVIDAEGRFVLPAWCDSHTHLVFAGTREREFEDRIKGMSYEDIARRGGGILNSAAKLAGMSEDLLFDHALVRLDEVAMQGTGAIEIKSGYGLSTEAEIKMLRVIKRLREESDLIVKSTFLGAHAIAAEYKNDRRKYIDLVLNEMMPRVAEENLADYADVFCESGYFSVNETLEIVEKAESLGMKSKIHVNQFNTLGAIPKLVAAGAVSVDHLEVMDEGDYVALSGAKTIATALPLCSLFLGIPCTPARELINRGAILALASDYNPGSAPSGNMSLAVSLACMKMSLTPAEAINAATINGAAAMEIGPIAGTVTAGKIANLIITKPCEHLSFLPYSFGAPAIDGMILNGKIKKSLQE